MSSLQELLKETHNEEFYLPVSSLCFIANTTERI